MTGKTVELKAFGFPDTVLNAWSDRFPDGLNELQLEAINEYRVLDGKSLLVVAPTSTGKTFVGEMAAARAVLDGRKAVFLLPYKALASEKYEQFDALYGERLGMRVIRCTSDYTDQREQFKRGKYDLALLTFEMFLALAVRNPSTLSQIGLVVLDEAQFITEPKRGITVELLLTFLIAARERGIEPQIVALSAVIGSINHFDEWLGCDTLVTDKRPVKLVEGVLDHGGVFQYRDDDGNAQTTQLVPRHLIVQRRQEASAQDVIIPLVRHLMTNPREKVIIFRNMRDKARSCANYLAAELGLLPAQEIINQLPAGDLSTDSAALRRCLRGGTAFHSTDLNRDERAIVERAFRTSDKVRALGATTTVAAGINTPASTVILADHEFVGEDRRNYTVAEYRNMAGRAGRLGLQEEGRSILYAETSFERQQLFQRFVMGQVEPIQSSFQQGEVETWLLRLLAQIPRVPADQVITLLASTYGGFLANLREPNWRTDTTARLRDLIQELLKWGLLEEDGEFLQLTPLGQACGRSSLVFRSCLRLIQLLREIPPDSLTDERLVALVQNLPESDGGFTPFFKGGKKEAPCPSRAAARFGRDIVLQYQQLALDGDYPRRCKRSCILADWIDGVAVEVIEERYNSNPYRGAVGHGDIRRFADNTRYQLPAAYEIASLVHITLPISAESTEGMVRRLEIGLPEGALPLLNLPVNLARGECLALVQAGYATAAQVWSASDEALSRAIGPERIAQLVALRPQRPTDEGGTPPR